MIQGIMLKSYEQLQTGLVTPNSFKSAMITNRLFSMDLSKHSVIRQCHNAGITVLDLDPAEDRFLLSGSKNGDLAIHDVLNNSGHPWYTAEIICRIRRNTEYAHRFCITSAQWYPFDTGLFITSSMDHKLKIWDTNILRPADTISMTHKISALHMSNLPSEHTLIAVAMEHPHVVLVDPRTGARCHELRAHCIGVSAVRWSPFAEHLLATGGRDNKIFFWDIRSANGYLRSLDQHNGEAVGNKKDMITAHNGRISSLKFTDNGLYMVSHGADNRIRLWDVALCKNTLVNYGSIQSIYANFQVSLDLCCDSSLPALFVPCNNSINVYDLFTGCRIRTLIGHFNLVTSCVFRSTTHELYSSGNDMNILLWTPDGEKELEAEREMYSPEHQRVTDNAESSFDTDNWSD